LKVDTAGNLAARWLIWGTKSALSLHPVTAPYYKALQYGIYGVETLHGVTANPDGGLELSDKDPDAQEAAGKLAWRGTKDAIGGIFGDKVGALMGILKRALAEWLAQQPLVEKFHTAPPEQGGNAITIVSLKV
jgi:hypothetical protein